MAATEPVGRAEAPGDAGGADEPAAESTVAVPVPRVPRVPTRALVVLVLVLAAVLVAGVVVSLVLLHQPRLVPLPVPSVSQI